jgi:hypothetical protein
MTVAALYIDPRGPYPALLGQELCWDEKRDARTYDGPWPVVAHPPCGPWGALKHQYEGTEHDCGPRAVEQVRKFGGVLEHPRRSGLWEKLALPWPDVMHGPLGKDYGPGCTDLWGGFSIQVDQCAWGHVARKTTWLYVVGVPYAVVREGIRTGGTPTHWTSGGRTVSSRKGSPVPPGIKVCSAQQRRRTPQAFAEWLISLAEQARPSAQRRSA